MESFEEAQAWLYPLVSFFVFIFSIVKLRYNGSIFFIIAFGLIFLNSILWRILPSAAGIFKINNSEIYNYFRFISSVVYICTSVFFVAGIAMLSEIKSEKHKEL